MNTKRTKEELMLVLETIFGLVPVVDRFCQKHVNLITPTGITIVQLVMLNRGTDDLMEL